MNITILDLLDFCLKHRSNKVFRGWTPEQIGSRIIQAHRCGGLAMTTANNLVTGIICATPDHDRKALHVNEILCIQRGAMKAMLKKYHSWYDGYTITASRGSGKERDVVYNTPRLVHLIEKSEL